MAGHGSMRPLDTASDPARSGLPGIQPGDPTGGVGELAINSLGSAFQKGLQGPGEMAESAMGGGGEGEGGGAGDALGMAMKIAPLLA